AAVVKIRFPRRANAHIFLNPPHMDRKSIIILVICGLLFLLWAELVPRFYPQPVPARRTNQTATTSTSNLPPPSISASTNLPSPPPAAEAVPSAPEELLAMSTSKARYTFTSYGGGLKLIELTQYPEAVA